MIFQAAYPLQQFTITNNFFYSPLKRRLAMLTKNKNSKINYLSRMLVLPLAALVFFAFTLKVKTVNNANPYYDKTIKTKELTTQTNDTIPKMYYKNRKVNGLKVFESEDKVIATYSDGTKETITKDEAEKRGFVLPPPPPSDSSYKAKDRGIEMANQKRLSSFNDSIPKFYKGKKMKGAQGDKLNKTFIYYEDGSTDTISTTEAEKLRIIPPPPPPPPAVDLDNNKVFTKVEVEPSFPGGDMAWARYIKKTIEGNINELSSENKSGTCRLRFIVDVDGSVRDVKVLSMQGTKLAEISLKALEKGPKWVPAMQNGHVVTAYREQPITFTIQEQ
jgi:protein TonB